MPLQHGGVDVHGGSNDPAHGVLARSPEAAIVKGVAEGANAQHVGVYGAGQDNTGVVAESKTGAGLVASGSPAAQFQGDVEVSGALKAGPLKAGPLEVVAGSQAGHSIAVNLSLTGALALHGGDITLFGGDIKLADAADCAEDFTVADACDVDPGAVVVLGPDGTVGLCLAAYDTRVLGVVSGAGAYRPGIVLDRRPSADKREPVALFGKVYCRVDGGYGEIAAGDLLTTSPTPGHAMKAVDKQRAFGAVISKALQSWSGGRGLIPIVVALQ